MAGRLREVVGTSGARGVVLMVQLLSTAATARFLGADGRGALVATVAWVSTFATIGYLSMAQPVFHRVSGVPVEEWLDETLGTLLAIVAAVSVLGWAAAAGLYLFTAGGTFGGLPAALLLIAFAALPFMLWQENGNALLLATGNLHVLNRLQVVSGLASLAAVLVAVGVLGWGIPGALAGVLLNYVLNSILAVAYLLPRCTRVRADWGVARALLAGGAKLHLNAVGAVLAGQVGILIINHYRSPEETAFYHLAGQMLIGLQIVPSAASAVAYAHIARQGPDRAWTEHRRLLAQMLAVTAGLGAVAYFAAPLGVKLLAGDGFGPAVPLFRILLLTVVGSTLAGLTVSQWVARGMFGALAGHGLVLGVLSVAGTFVVVPRWGMTGAAWLGVAISALSLLVNGAVVIWIEKRWRRTVRYAA